MTSKAVETASEWVRINSGLKPGVNDTGGWLQLYVAQNLDKRIR